MSDLIYRPRLKIYKSKCGKNKFDQNTCIATSYNWWPYTFLHPDKKNTVIINMGFYSITTRQHQYDARNLLAKLGYKVIEIDIGSSKLTYPMFLSDGTRNIRVKIKQLLVEMNRRGSKKEKNKERLCILERYKRELGLLIDLGARFNLDDFEMEVNVAISEDMEKKPTNKMNTSKIKVVKPLLNDFNEVVFLSKQANDLSKISFIQKNN